MRDSAQNSPGRYDSTNLNVHRTGEVTTLRTYHEQLAAHKAVMNHGGHDKALIMDMLFQPPRTTKHDPTTKKVRWVK